MAILLSMFLQSAINAFTVVTVFKALGVRHRAARKTVGDRTGTGMGAGGCAVMSL